VDQTNRVERAPAQEKQQQKREGEEERSPRQRESPKMEASQIGKIPPLVQHLRFCTRRKSLKMRKRRRTERIDREEGMSRPFVRGDTCWSGSSYEFWTDADQRAKSAGKGTEKGEYACKGESPSSGAEGVVSKILLKSPKQHRSESTLIRRPSASSCVRRDPTGVYSKCFEKHSRRRETLWDVSRKEAR